MTCRPCIACIAAAVAFIAALYLTAAFAQAQTACEKRASMVRQLAEKYGETRRGAGLSGPTAIFEIWASDKPPNTWTILKSTPNGIACIMAVGDDWHDDPGTTTPTGNPA